MTKTILTAMILFYSLVRLAAIGILSYYSVLNLPVSVVIITSICCIISIVTAARCYLCRLSGKNLRAALLLGAVTATVNMLILMVAQPGNLNNYQLLVSGTVFDILLFAGSCTIKIRDTRGKLGRTPFSRAAMQDTDR